MLRTSISIILPTVNAIFSVIYDVNYQIANTPIQL